MCSLPWGQFWERYLHKHKCRIIHTIISNKNVPPMHMNCELVRQPPQDTFSSWNDVYQGIVCGKQALSVPLQSSSISLPIWTNFHYTSDWKLCRTQRIHSGRQTCGEKRKFLTPFLGTMLCYVLVASYILTQRNVFKIGWETFKIFTELYRPDLLISSFIFKMLPVNSNSTFYDPALHFLPCVSR